MEETESCPSCHLKGQKVKNTTVKHLVFEDLAKKIDDEENYYLCMNKDCEAVYYSSDGKNIFYQQEVKVPVWFKKEANPKYICYCNEVTDQQIIDLVLHGDAKDMKDIIKLTGAMKNAQCEIKNPAGKCCGPIILKTIQEALDIQ